MISIKSQPLFLYLETLLLISSTFWSHSHAASQSHHHLPSQQLQRKIVECHAEVRGMERLVLEGQNDKLAKNSTLKLAANRTHRIDPLNQFNYYNGGWDYKNQHYWASVSFSAAPLFITAAAWFLLLGLSLLLRCLCCCCCRKESYDYSRLAYALSLIFLVLFTIAAIAGCGVLYINQGKFSNSVTYALESIVKKGISIFENFMSIVDALASAMKVSVNQYSLPADMKNQIVDVDKMIKATANIPEIQSLANEKYIQKVLHPVRTALNVLVAVMLILAFLGFLSSIFGMRFCMYILVIIGWILVTMILILCGVFLMFHNVVADTCVAMDDWLKNPTANSPLNLQFLPCVEKRVAHEALVTSKETSFSLINIVNQYIINVANKDLPPDAGILYHNQSGPLVPILCNPFNSNITKRKCASGEVDFSNVEQEWRKYVCHVSAEGICTTTGRLTPNAFDQLTASVNISRTLYHYGPFLVKIADCSFVQKTFHEVSRDLCPGLRRYSFRTYVGLALVSASIMCSVIFWIFYARERQQRTYNKLIIMSEENALIGRRT